MTLNTIITHPPIEDFIDAMYHNTKRLLPFVIEGPNFPNGQQTIRVYISSMKKNDTCGFAYSFQGYTRTKFPNKPKGAIVDVKGSIIFGGNKGAMNIDMESQSLTSQQV